MSKARLSRRRVLSAAVGGAIVVIGGGTTALELVSHGVLPGGQLLDRLDGACSVSYRPFQFSGRGSAISGSFFSRKRNCNVGYTLAFPPGHVQGSGVPLIVMLHGETGNHKTALVGMSPQQAVAIRVDGSEVPPIALVTVDGGLGYWNPHPGDDPMGMVIDELIPRCQELGAGRPPFRIGTMGVSMGGYGALLFGEKYPELIRVVAAISPAIWTSYEQARSVNRDAYASAADFASCDAVTHAGALADTPVRIASGENDPFHPGVEALVSNLANKTNVEFEKGCHTSEFFASQEAPSLAFLAEHLRS